MSATAILDVLRSRRDEMLDALRVLVEHESPSRDKAALDALADVIAGQLSDVGGEVERVANAEGGDHVLARFGGGPGRPAMVLGHFDTVWAEGTLATRPFRVEGDRAFGPGTFDMKAGVVIAEFALDALRDHGLRRPVVVLFTSDEEIGSPTSRDLIERHARDCEYVFVLEPPLAGGRLKTARKGVGGFTLTIDGREAHAGIEPEKGVSAVVELAHQVLRVHGLARPEAGTTVNVGVVEGGTAPNVVPARATARVDVRVTTSAEARRIDEAFLTIEAVTPGARVAAQGRFNRPPMERTPRIAALFEKAREIGASLGLDLTEGSTGGASDGNFTAALGAPTLDGLGALGDGAHAKHEHILISSLPERAALLAALLLEVD